MKMYQNPEIVASLITKFLQDRLSAQEKADFDCWLAADPKNAELVETFRNVSEVQQEVDYINNIDVNEGWNTFSAKISAKPTASINWKKYGRYSAAAILFCTLSFGLYQNLTHKQATLLQTNIQEQKPDILPGTQKAILAMADGSTIHIDSKTNYQQLKSETKLKIEDGFLSYNDEPSNMSGYYAVKTPIAGEYKVMLPDGTKVFLNSASSIKFAANFNQRKRVVELQGEAYFEVAKNKDKPFSVRFNSNTVEVLGTHFNINSYNDESKTTLIEGAIEITSGKNRQLLQPGEEASIKEGKLSINQVNVYKSIAWKEGIFYFHEDEMKDILANVARWYDIQVLYQGKPTSKRYSGEIRRLATLQQVLEMLSVVSGAKFKLENRNLTVNF